MTTTTTATRAPRGRRIRFTPGSRQARTEAKRQADLARRRFERSCQRQAALWSTIMQSQSPKP